MIPWFARNGIAADFLMLAILAGGIHMAVFRTPLEITPALSWRTVMIEMTPSFLSVFGMLALAGISVNNSLVLVDFVNQRLAAGATLDDAAREAGLRRFQPILLTSITTFVGLSPMFFDRLLEAQFLIPMAVSMGFGILFTTVITLFLVPCVLMLSDDVTSAWRRWTTGTVATSAPSPFASPHP